MGLLDWLTDAIGGLGNAATDPSTMGGVSSAGTMTGAPPIAPPGGSDAAALANPPMPSPQASSPPLGPDSPQNPTGGQVPLPMARPDAAGSGTPPLPPPQQITPPVPAAGVDVPGAMKSYAAAGGTMEPPATAPGNGPAAHTFIGRALGLDPNRERSALGGLAAGLTAAGNSAGKSKFQAFASGAGATLGGQQTADDKTEDKQRKYLDQAISAMKAGDQRQANLALTQLRQAQTKMTLEGKIGKDSVMNSDAQLYLRAQGATNQDANLKILKSQYDKIAVERGASSPEAKTAMDAYQKAYDDTLNGHLSRLGLDPKTADKIGKQPGMSQDNAIPKEKMNSQEAFDKLPPGSWFVNPKDGKILQKPMQPVAQPGGGAATPGGQTLPAGQGGVPAPQPSSNLPPLPPRTPTASAIPGIDADESADEKEPA